MLPSDTPFDDTLCGAHGFAEPTSPLQRVAHIDSLAQCLNSVILTMKIFGNAKRNLESEQVSSDELAEITLCATPNELRRMGEFLAACAAEMDRMGDAYDHLHLGDRMKEFDTSSPHVVVFRASAE